ncbi:hypothetical protein NSND_50287 [Nitrospira sp. ND1]|nr:hypothetical protein NSND_50287 [Nitrospira sp. ND1]
MSLSWTEGQQTWKGKCTASCDERRYVALASAAVSRNGWVGQAPTAGWLVLKMPQSGRLAKLMKVCRLVQARDSSTPEHAIAQAFWGKGGVEDSPFYETFISHRCY